VRVEDGETFGLREVDEVIAHDAERAPGQSGEAA
jgi:hypothetical protein